MPVEHIIFAEQAAAWTTWVTPDKAIPVDSWSLDPGIEYHQRRLTGQGRGLTHMWLAAKRPTGSFEMPAWYSYLGYFLKAAGLHDIASTQQGGTAAYQHGFFPKDDTVPLGLSVQLKRDSDDADNIMGVLLNSLTFRCQAGESLILAGDYVAYDEAPTDGTWEGGDAAPAVVATPSYFADTILPYRFQHGTLTYGATLSYDNTENVYTKTGGSSATIEMVEVALENNWDPRVFLGSRLAGNVIGQDRVISGRFDLDQSTVDETFRNLHRAGTAGTLWLEFDSGVEADTGYNYKMIIVVPNVKYSAGALPDLSGSNDRRMQSVEFVGLNDGDDVDFNVQIVDTATSY